MQQHSPRLLPQLRSYAGGAVDVNDLLQEVWLRAYHKRRTFEGRGSLLGWLLAICRTVGLAAAEKRQRREAVIEELGDVVHPTTRADSDLLRDALRHAVLQLPERQREVLLLRLVEGHSTAETARLLHCAEGTVKATLHHATRRLQQLLKENVT